MAAGRHGGYRYNEFRDRDSDLDLFKRRDYYGGQEFARCQDPRSMARVWSRGDQKRSPLAESGRSNFRVRSCDEVPKILGKKRKLESSLAIIDSRIKDEPTEGVVLPPPEKPQDADSSFARPISSSRWATTDEAKEILPQRAKISPLAKKKTPSPELGEIISRECSERDSDDDMDVDREDGSGDDESLDSEEERSSPSRGGINMLQGCRSVNDFHCEHRINEGTYGIVFKGKDMKTGEVVALKKVKMEKEREGFPLTALREINILLSFDHPSIVRVKEVVVNDHLDGVFMVMEYLENDLKGVMEMKKQPFSQSEVKCLMLQLLEGVKYLHDNWVLHRDLKTSNLLMNNQGELKICDFGLARQYGSPLKPYTQLVVTLWYRAPELLLGATEYSTAIDMWSIGCIMAELLAKKPLFNGETEVDQLDKIFRTLGTPNEKIWNGFSKLPGAKANFVRQRYNKLREKFPATSFIGGPTLSEAGIDLLNKLLTYDPEERITAEDALKHDWFREVPLPKSKEFMPTFPAQNAKNRCQQRVMKSPDPLEELRRKELQQGDQLGSGSLFG